MNQKTIIFVVIGAVMIGLAYILLSPKNANSAQNFLGGSPATYTPNGTLVRPGYGSPTYVGNVAPASALTGVFSGLSDLTNAIGSFFKSPSPVVSPQNPPSGVIAPVQPATTINLNPNAPINQGLNLFDPQYSADPLLSDLANGNGGIDPLTGELDPTYSNPSADTAASGFDPSATLDGSSITSDSSATVYA